VRNRMSRKLVESSRERIQRTPFGERPGVICVICGKRDRQHRRADDRPIGAGACSLSPRATVRVYLARPMAAQGALFEEAAAVSETAEAPDHELSHGGVTRARILLL
jgi:hypothetical protein